MSHNRSNSEVVNGSPEPSGNVEDGHAMLFEIWVEERVSYMNTRGYANR